MTLLNILSKINQVLLTNDKFFITYLPQISPIATPNQIQDNTRL